MAASSLRQIGYSATMTFALRFAEVNRSRMLDVAEATFGAHTRVGRFDLGVDVHHNYAAWENHFGTNGIVHRKGAVRARAGEIVLIPGSMGTASYVAEGLGDAESFETCQHGAGRAMSRTAARKGKTSDEVFTETAELGATLLSGARRRSRRRQRSPTRTSRRLSPRRRRSFGRRSG
jgi:tRNA-splicing ligase RtcB (3'-phosphate/5'-hydroxy nucleic acid ligase)